MPRLLHQLCLGGVLLACGLRAQDGVGDRLAYRDAEAAIRAGDSRHALQALQDLGRDHRGMSPDEILALRNGAANRLLADPDCPIRDFGEVLLTQAQDPAEPAPWRDYCLQFLNEGYPHWPHDQKERAVALFLAAARETRGAAGGTALLALCHQVDGHLIQPEQVSQLVLAAAIDPAYGDPGRVTALQLCAELGLREAAPAARDILRAKGDIHLRCSAIVALGRLGGPDDIALLQPFTRLSDARLGPPARTAIARLQSQNKKPDRETTP